MSWPDLPSMGGYGLYVWGAYVVTAVAMAAEIALVVRRRRRSRPRPHDVARAGEGGT